MRCAMLPPRTPTCPGVGTAVPSLCSRAQFSICLPRGPYSPGRVDFRCGLPKPPGLASSLRKHTRRGRIDVSMQCCSIARLQTLSRHGAPSSSPGDTRGDGPLVRVRVKD